MHGRKVAAFFKLCCWWNFNNRPIGPLNRGFTLLGKDHRAIVTSYLSSSTSSVPLSFSGLFFAEGHSLRFHPRRHSRLKIPGTFCILGGPHMWSTSPSGRLSNFYCHRRSTTWTLGPSGKVTDGDDHHLCSWRGILTTFLPLLDEYWKSKAKIAGYLEINVNHLCILLEDC